MPLDPDLTGLVQSARAGTPLHQLTVEQARSRLRAQSPPPPEHDEAVSSQDVTVAGAAGPLDARVYRPVGEDACPTVLYFHGGGWVLGDLDTHDGLARAICRRARAVVVSVAYRLAPEHPFPAAVEDAVAVTRWLAERLPEHGGDGRLAVAGDSAGGNLAAVVARTVPGVVAQLLICATTDPYGDYGSRTENATGYLLEREGMDWLLRQYAPDRASAADPRLAPLRGASLSGLPPTVVVVAELDPLRDEGEAYAAALRDAGVPTVLRRYEGLPHGFTGMGGLSPVARAAADDALDCFSSVLGR